LTTPAQQARQIRLTARTFASRLEDIAEDFVGRDEVVRVLGLATLCREHVLLIGPPGTAKTSLLDRFRRMLDVRYFGYLLTRFTEPAELFGPMDVSLFQQRSVFRVNTKGMLPEAHLAFLDEVFQGSSAILNTLLTLINERTFHNGEEIQRTPLLTVLGSTNELPDDPVLAAFSDRFLLRCNLDYVSPDQIEEVLGLGWKHEREAILADTADVPLDTNLARFHLADLTVLQHAVTRIDVSEVRGQLAQVVRTLRSEGVVFSDRRAVKAQKLIAASALLGARTEAVTADLSVLAYLWTRQEDRTTVGRVLADHNVPVDERLRQHRDPAALVLDLNQVSSVDGPGTREALRERVRLLHRLSVEARQDHAAETDLQSRIKQAYQTALTALQEHENEGEASHV
jgi:MoxR-like ATPase